jgi:hypothetical protein
LPGQVVELAALDRLADLALNPAFVPHIDMIFSELLAHWYGNLNRWMRGASA